MPANPFEVTKAVDFTDEQIAATWVDLPGGGFGALADPRSPMPRFLVGGKGGGRTHLLRYFSYPLQRLRHRENLLNGIRSDGYVGIYFRCGGLNSSRFIGKGQDPDAWGTVFSYYTEVWLARLTVDLIRDVLAVSEADSSESRLTFAKAVLDLFDTRIGLPDLRTDPLGGLADTLHSIQRRLDIAINNAALTHTLDVDVGASPGRLVFGIPAAAAEHLAAFKKMVFAYLVDEYENLTLSQQQYINTLIREKELPATFLIGSRRYGLRTHETLSAGEENRQGSEFDLVVLEHTYRSRAHKYEVFCVEIVRKRLGEYGLDSGADGGMAEFFEEPIGTLEERARKHVVERVKAGQIRPWLERLREQVRIVGRTEDFSALLAAVEFKDSPLHEKFALFLFYRAWADGKDLLAAASENRSRINALLTGDGNMRKLATTYSHYKYDLYAQLLREFSLPQEYYGFESFVRMSGFLPRNLLVVLKQVTRWALFLGERPFRGTKVSLRAQREGVREASEWFLSDAQSLGRVGKETQVAIRRLGSLFHELRFSDKPVEVSCSTFATDRQGLSPSAANVLDDAVAHSLIIEIPKGRRERNIGVLQHKYQLNPMLAPLFDLSLALRGVASFPSRDLSAIFDSGVSESEFGGVQRRLLGRMRAPFQGETSQGNGLFD